MSKFMLIVGLLFAAIGIALGFMVALSPGQMQVVAITPEVATLFMVGGAICLGLGGVIGSLEEASFKESEPVAPIAAASLPVSEELVIPEFTRRLHKMMPPTKTEEELSPSVRETITALENARSDIDRALSEEPKPDEPVAEAAPEPEPETAEELPEEEVGADAAAAEDADQLYVVEEKMIRGRPARVLSDGTVEAETDEGWMRFENLEHLDEYLEAMAPAAKS